MGEKAVSAAWVRKQDSGRVVGARNALPLREEVPDASSELGHFLGSQWESRPQVVPPSPFRPAPRSARAPRVALVAEARSRLASGSAPERLARAER